MQRTQPFRGGILLRELISNGVFRDARDVRVTACCSDAALCQPGDLYVALTGAEDDGHDRVREAVRNGASAILAERMIPVDPPTCIVPDTREAFGQVCHGLAGQPCERLKTFGITGTNGKTATSQLLVGVLKAAGQAVAHATTIGRFDGVRAEPVARTTPAAAELASWLARSEARGCTHAVVEASSSGLAERRLAGTRFDGVILTNVRRDHLDIHATVANYRKAKARIFGLLKPGGFAVINADDPASRFLLPEMDRPVITFGRGQPADVTAYVVERFKSEQTFLLSAGHETVPIRSAMIGDHHVSNCMAAAAVGLVMGIPLTTIARGLESVGRVPGRLDRVECGQEYGLYVDCADTPDRLAVSLRAVRQVTPGRVICVYGGQHDRQQEQRPMLGRVAERYADVGIITSGDDCCQDALETAHQILDGYDRPARARVIPTRSEAIRWALAEARPEDSVLIAGSARRTLGGEPDGELAANDLDFARRWLRESAALGEATVTMAAAG